MSLLETIKSDQLKSRKAKDAFKSKVLTTLYSEALRVGKDDGDRETTDKEVLEVIGKFSKNLTTMRSLINDPAAQKECDDELQILAGYLPEPLTAEEIKNIVLALGMSGVREQKTFLSSTVKHFAEEYTGRYENQALIAIIRSHIAGTLE